MAKDEDEQEENEDDSQKDWCQKADNKEHTKCF